jgi:DNA-damage-inducible protein D
MITKIAVFRNKKIRKLIYNTEWWFSVVDVVEALTDSENPRDYWYRMKVREKSEGGVELSTFCRQLKLESSDDKSLKLIVQILKVFFELFSPFPHRKLSHLKCGSRV